MKKIFGIFVIVIVFLTSCTTIGTQQYTYVGSDVTPLPNISGKSTHFDVAGIGVDANAYADEYNRAIKDAFKNGPANMDKLNNVKIFKANQYWPQVLGISAMILGSVLSVNTKTSGAGVAILGAGAITASINTYDFVVVGEPHYRQ